MSHQQREQQRRDDNATLPLTTVPLDNGWALGEGICPDGTTAFWLVSPDGDDAPQGCACPGCAPWETDLGRKVLPDRCGAVTKTTGRACTVRTRLGERCYRHRDQGAEAPTPAGAETPARRA